MISGLDHINIHTDDLDRTVEFYRDVLGLDPRPKPSGNTGAWLYAGDQAVVHVDVTNGQLDQTSSSNLNHVAFKADDLDAAIAALKSANVAHTVVPRPAINLTLVNFVDPNGIPIELTIPL